MAPKTRPVMERFWAKVQIGSPNDCWPWTGTHVRGYGRFWIGSRTDGSRRPVIASRFLYAQQVGEIPDGMQVLHRCDNPPCVNPHHLFLGTARDNVVDMLVKGRQANQRKTSCLRGHAFTPANTRVRSDGRRDCKSCERDRDSARNIERGVA